MTPVEGTGQRQFKALMGHGQVLGDNLYWLLVMGLLPVTMMLQLRNHEEFTLTWSDPPSEDKDGETCLCKALRLTKENTDGTERVDTLLSAASSTRWKFSIIFLFVFQTLFGLALTGTQAAHAIAAVEQGEWSK
jgi:hypothetical protein